MLRIETRTLATPSSSAKQQVRIRPVNGEKWGKCPFHIDDRCSVHENKPKGGKEFKCWVPETFDRTYFWSDRDLLKLGFIN